MVIKEPWALTRPQVAIKVSAPINESRQGRSVQPSITLKHRFKYSPPSELCRAMRAQLILGYRRDIAPMEPHLGWSRNVPMISLTSGGGVGGARFHVSRVMGCKGEGESPCVYTKTEAQ